MVLIKIFLALFLLRALVNLALLVAYYSGAINIDINVFYNVNLLFVCLDMLTLFIHIITK